MAEETVKITITTKGLAWTADWLYKEGLLRKKHRDRIVWLYESGIAADHPSVRKAWRKMMPAVYQMRDILSAEAPNAED